MVPLRATPQLQRALALAVALGSGCFAAQGTLGTDCRSDSNCIDGLSCLQLANGSGVCTTGCSATAPCQDGVCVVTEVGMECAYGCDTSLSCESDQTCGISTSAQQPVCWISDSNFTPIGDFSVTFVLRVNGAVVSTLPMTASGDVSITIKNTSPQPATSVWATAISLPTDATSSGVSWAISSVNEAACTFRLSTTDYDCQTAADDLSVSAPNGGTLQPGATESYLQISSIHFQTGTPPQQELSIALQVDANSGQQSNLSISIPVSQ
jgi:hypothetical protein